MAESNPPAYLQSSGQLHSAKLTRRALGALMSEGVCAFNTAGDMKVVETSPAGMQVRMERGGAYIQGDDTTDQGLYFCYNDAYDSVVLSAANPTNPRDDIIIARVRDNTEGIAGDLWEFAVVTGTPAASPVEPATPASALKLATVRVGAGVTTIVNANITDRRINSSMKSSFLGLVAWNSIDTATGALYTMDSEGIDTSDLHSTSENTSRIYATASGIWLLRLHLTLDIGDPEDISLRKNGTTTIIKGLTPFNNEPVISQVLLSLQEGDYIEVVPNPSLIVRIDGGNPYTDTGSQFSVLEFRRLGV